MYVCMVVVVLVVVQGVFWGKMNAYMVVVEEVEGWCTTN